MFVNKHFANFMGKQLENSEELNVKISGYYLYVTKNIKE